MNLAKELAGLDINACLETLKATENAALIDVRSEDEFAARYEALTHTLLQTDYCCGFCYTQLYDIEQERNGLYTYARERKFSQAVYDRIRKANTETAAIEKRLRR